MEPFTLERHGDHLLVWSDGWPGLLSGGASEDRIVEQLPLSIAEFCHWLGSEGTLPDARGYIATRVDRTPDDAAGRDPCLPSDLMPLATPEFERFLAITERSQADLRDAADVPDALLDWLPPGLVAEHPDPWAPDIRTIRGILKHALQLEVFYRGGLVDGPAPGIFERVATPAEEHTGTLNLLRSLPHVDRARVFHPERHNPARTATLPDEWTVRKVIRRLVSHNRAHTAEIVQRRTWVLLGPPGG